MKPILEIGYLATSENAIFKAEKLTLVKKIFIINNSSSTVYITVNRVANNEVSNMVRVNLPLAAYYSIDILDPGESLWFAKGDFIRAKATASNSVRYSIDAEEQ